MDNRGLPPQTSTFTASPAEPGELPWGLGSTSYYPDMSEDEIVAPTPKPARHAVVINVGRRSFTWSIWNLTKGKLVQNSTQRFCTLREAWADGLTQRQLSDPD
jgi:hypothetical protein